MSAPCQPQSGGGLSLLLVDLVYRTAAVLFGLFLFIVTTIRLLRPAVVARTLTSTVSDAIAPSITGLHQLIACRRKTCVKQDSVLALNGLLIILGQLLSWLLLYFVACGLWALHTIYNAFINREADISLLAATGGQPYWGLEPLARLTLNDQLGDIPTHMNAWTNWFGNLRLTHTTYPGLVQIRSACPTSTGLSRVFPP
ncbi:MAG: hypothetical protein OSA11_10495 [Candidatus Nanopelagicales bacterium]|nr:hypothetical protein [Candidatus Nanopelagicales bacterium]